MSTTRLEKKLKKQNRKITAPINKLKANIEFASTKEKPIKTILITSTGANEGKSTIVYFLASTMARANNKVLIIETNVYHPTIGKKLDCSSRIGWGDYLRVAKQQSETPLEVKEIIRQTSVNNLDFIDCGKLITNHVEMLKSQAFCALVEKTKQLYDFIIIDSPALNLFVDAIVVSPFVDATVLVIDYGQVRALDAKNAIKQLVNAKANVIGAVINRANTPKILR